MKAEVAKGKRPREYKIRNGNSTTETSHVCSHTASPTGIWTRRAFKWAAAGRTLGRSTSS